MGANRQPRANSNTERFEVLMGSMIEDISEELEKAVEAAIKKISDAVDKAAGKAVKKISNEERSAVSGRKEANLPAPLLPVNALGTLKPNPLNDSPKNRPETRILAPKVTAINNKRSEYLLKESPWRLYMKELQGYRFSILLAIILVYLIASHGLQSATITLLRWAGTDSLRYSLKTLCEGNDKIQSPYVTSKY
jgi:hypothetical protein